MVDLPFAVSLVLDSPLHADHHYLDFFFFIFWLHGRFLFFKINSFNRKWLLNDVKLRIRITDIPMVSKVFPIIENIKYLNISIEMLGH